MPAKSQDEFLNLPFREKLEFLYGLQARRKRDLILSAPEAERLVQSFSPETLFFTLKEIGSSDAGDLLSLALPEQVQGLFDLDCWDRDRPDLTRMREWIEAMAEGGRKKMTEGLMGLDLELVALLLRRYVRVHLLEDPYNPPEPPENQCLQLDDRYLIEFVRYDSITPQITEFLEEVFECDYAYFTDLMDETYGGADAELEEQAYRFRGARLNDRGFPDFVNAQDVFSYLNPREFLKIRAAFAPPSRTDLFEADEPIAPEMAPVLAGGDNSLFNSALTAGFAAEGKRQLRAEMAMVTNHVLVARAVDFGNLDAVRMVVGMTHDYLNLALEHLSGGELSRAIEYLRDTHLKLLFRLGVSLTVDLRQRAREVVSALGLSVQGRTEVAYLDSPYRESLAGFLEKRPRFYTGLDGAGSVTMRDFRTERDLQMAYAVLEQIETMAELLRALLGVDLRSAAFRAAVAGREIRLSQILLTALARVALEGELGTEPIKMRRLGELRERLFDHSRPAKLSGAVRGRFAAVLETRLNERLLKRSAGFISSCLSMLEEEFAELQPQREIDPRFIRTLLIAAS